MKEIKLLFGVTLITLLTLSCSKENTDTGQDNVVETGKLSDGQVIGEKIGGVWVVTTNIPTLCADFNAIAAEQAVTTNYNDAKIKVSYSGTQGTRYGLYLYEASELSIGAASLIIDGNYAKIPPKALGVSTGATIVCTGTCSIGCDPEEYDLTAGGTVWGCSPCWAGCTKTVTRNIP